MNLVEEHIKLQVWSKKEQIKVGFQILARNLPDLSSYYYYSYYLFPRTASHITKWCSKATHQIFGIDELKLHEL